MCVRCAWHCFDSFAFLGSLSQALYVHTQREWERDTYRARERGRQDTLCSSFHSNLLFAVYALCACLCSFYVVRLLVEEVETETETETAR